VAAVEGAVGEEEVEEEAVVVVVEAAEVGAEEGEPRRESLPS
jgi:hypothetical protein